MPYLQLPADDVKYKGHWSTLRSLWWLLFCMEVSSEAREGTTEGGLTMTSASALSTQWYILLGPRGLCMSSLFKCSLTRFSSTKVHLSCSSLSRWSLGIPGNFVFLAKAEMKKTLSTSALSMSCVTRTPAPFSSRPTFSIVFLLPLMYLWKLILLLLTFLARVNSRWLRLFPNHVCLLRRCFYIYRRLPDPNSTFCILHFEVWVFPESP